MRRDEPPDSNADVSWRCGGCHLVFSAGLRSRQSRQLPPPPLSAGTAGPNRSAEPTAPGHLPNLPYRTGWKGKGLLPAPAAGTNPDESIPAYLPTSSKPLPSTGCSSLLGVRNG